MKNKRYSIVRVDNHCPEGLYENIKPSILCPKDGDCEKCNYGDTKEQLIKKVQQALFKSIFNDNVQKVVSVEEQKRIYKGYRPMAEKVVEFLGVK